MKTNLTLYEIKPNTGLDITGREQATAEMTVLNPGKQGDVFLEVVTGGNACIVTVVTSELYQDSIELVQPNKTAIIGPFPPEQFNTESDHMVVLCSDVATTQIRAITLLEV